jgi:type I restriction enzyme M protein
MSSPAIVQKLWNYCNVLRDDGMSYGDYPSAESILSAAGGLRTGCEPLTYLLFLFTFASNAGRKMADERT